MVTVDLKPPLAKKVRRVTKWFDQERTDSYHWFRDDARKSPEFLEYLKSEAVMSDSREFRGSLHKEMRGTIKKAGMSVPVRKGAFFYYRKDLEGKQYRQHCRRAIPGGEGPGHVDEVMETGQGAREEQILLDENVLAAKHEFYYVGTLKVSPSHKLFAVTEDFTGNEIYTIRVVNIKTRQDVGSKITGATESVVWGDDNTLYYLTRDGAQRPYKVWRHHVGSHQSSDKCLYHERDLQHWLTVGSSQSDKYLFVTSRSNMTQFVLFLDKRSPDGDLEYVMPRVNGVSISVAHTRDHFIITKRSEEVYNSELLVCPVNDRSAPVVLLPHRPSVKLQRVSTAQDHVVVQECKIGLVTLTVYTLPPAGEPILSLGVGRKVEFPEPACSVWLAESQFKSSLLRYVYSSLATPPSVYDYDMCTGRAVPKKVQAVTEHRESTLLGVFGRNWRRGSNMCAATAAIDQCDRLPDSLILLILNKVTDVKALGRCCAVSRRFNTLAPLVNNVVVKVDCVISGEENNVKGRGLLSIMRSFVGSLFKPIQALQHILGPKKTILATEISHHSPGEVLKNFKEIQTLRIELPAGELGIEEGVLLKWKAEFGSTLESCVILGAAALVKGTEGGNKAQSSGENGLMSQQDDSGLIPPSFYTDGGLKLRVVWTISSLIAASARHYLLQQIISDHPTLESLILTDANGQGMLCMSKQQLKEFRNKPPAPSTSSNRTQVPALNMKLWYAPYLELSSGTGLKGATLVDIRPTDHPVQKESEPLIVEAFEEPYRTAASILAKRRTYLLEMNSF
ncbi:hypothetical protein R1sor_013960 [Riccia sorocarpa]|uniref:Peptidase S9A N-terminal domain-containing protein n=1 Tax=Riccia sorocarpa TaxID=122646 RepID=A0ABD3H9W9_9MARC